MLSSTILCLLPPTTRSTTVTNQYLKVQNLLWKNQEDCVGPITRNGIFAREPLDTAPYIEEKVEAMQSVPINLNQTIRAMAGTLAFWLQERQGSKTNPQFAVP